MGLLTNKFQEDNVIVEKFNTSILLNFGSKVTGFSIKDEKKHYYEKFVAN